MKTRQSLVERFSSFIQWENNKFKAWISDLTLRRNMERYLSSDTSSPTAEQYWVLFWHKDWLKKRDEKNSAKSIIIDEKKLKLQNIAQQHLYAYLQEVCYWSAVNFEQNYKNRFEYRSEDYFNIAVLKFNDILSNFNPQLNPNLRTYASMRLKWAIIDEMRRVNRTFGYTTWSLLLNCTETRLTKALIEAGILRENLEKYLIVLDYYKELYASSKIKLNGKLQEPNLETWEKIAAACKKENPLLPIDVVQVKKSLKTCGEALLNYLSPQMISTNMLISADGEKELEDFLADPKQDLLLETLEEREKIAENFQQISTWLKIEIEELDREKQSILEMYYGKKMSQTEIGKSLTPPLKQYQVYRAIARINKKLAKSFLKWSQEKLNISLEADDIDNIVEALKQWLQHHYQTIDGEQRE